MSTEIEEIRKLTRAKAMKAKCADCMGNYADGKVSCEVPECPMFFFMPHRKKFTDKFVEEYPDLAAELLAGTKKRKKRKLSPEHLAAMKRGREKARAKETA